MKSKPDRLLIIIIATVLLSSCLIGCNRSRPIVIDDENDRLPKKLVNGSDPAVIKMQNSLNRRGIKVVTIGQDYLISIASSALFTDQAPQLTWQSYALLNDVIRFMKLFRKVSVTVTAYSNKYRSSQREHALTLARARGVADYLWSQCPDTRFIFTEGAGSDKPIVGTKQGADCSPNSRIEITFREAIV